MKFWNMTIENDKASYALYIRAEIFNPFKERDPNAMVPTFNFLPQIGVNLRRSKKYGLESVRVILGWFNAYAEFSAIIFRKINL